MFDVDHDTERAQAAGLEPNGFNFEGADPSGVDYALNRSVNMYNLMSAFSSSLEVDFPTPHIVLKRKSMLFKCFVHTGNPSFPRKSDKLYYFALSLLITIHFLRFIYVVFQSHDCIHVAIISI